MSLNELWQRYRQQGYGAVVELQPDTALDRFYLAVLAYAAGEYPLARDHAQMALEYEPEHLVFREAAHYLAQVAEHGKQRVYLSPESFSAFARGGGNVPLYEKTSAALRSIYDEYDSLSLLDVGVGEGYALLPALQSSVQRVDLVEPAGKALQYTIQVLTERGIPHDCHAETIQVFMTRPQGHWDVVQSSFCLQSLLPSERHGVFSWMRQHADRTVIVEFDVPPVSATLAPTHLLHVLERYQVGLAEYDSTRTLVAQGFLMPVMFGYFDPTQARTNYEQPAAEWESQLYAAGFTQVRTQRLYDFWWAPVCLLDARA